MAPAADRSALLLPFVNALHNQGRLRVWSVLITIFGDLAGPLPGQLALRDIHQLTRLLGITDGAVRTALSRLLAEDWLISGKAGRHAFYALSKTGIEAVATASARLYAGPGQPPDAGWQLVMTASTAVPAGLEQGGIKLAADCWLMPASARAPADALVLQGKISDRPGWLADRLAGQKLTKDYDQLADLIKPLLADPPSIAALPAVEAMALRVLLVHFWRRLALRHNPDLFWLLGDDWPGSLVARQTAFVWHQILPVSEKWQTTASQRAPAGLLARRFPQG